MREMDNCEDQYTSVYIDRGTSISSDRKLIKKNRRRDESFAPDNSRTIEVQMGPTRRALR